MPALNARATHCATTGTATHREGTTTHCHNRPASCSYSTLRIANFNSVEAYINAVKNDANEQREKRRKPFNEEQLVASWLKYANSVPDEVALYNTMQSHKPMLKGDVICKVDVESTIQESLILVTKDALLKFLQNELENDYIDLETEIKISNERRVSYNTGEILSAMQEDNPYLAKAVEKLNLEIE